MTITKNLQLKLTRRETIEYSGNLLLCASIFEIIGYKEIAQKLQNESKKISEKFQEKFLEEHKNYFDGHDITGKYI